MKTKPKVLLEKRGQAPSPLKDYHQLQVTEEHVTMITWKISLRKDSIGKGPVQNKLTHEEFYYDTQMTSAIRNVFGAHVQLLVEGLVHGDWLARMETPLLTQIFSYLDLSDIFRTSLVCRYFHHVCNGDALWRRVYEMYCGDTSPDVVRLGREMGWKKMFFTNKLQIRKEVSRLRTRTAEAGARRSEDLVESDSPSKQFFLTS